MEHVIGRASAATVTQSRIVASFVCGPTRRWRYHCSLGAWSKVGQARLAHLVAPSSEAALHRCVWGGYG
jgi:hypothetical protein